MGLYTDSGRESVALIKRRWPYLLAVLAVSVLALTTIVRVQASSRTAPTPSVSTPSVSTPSVSTPSASTTAASLSTNSATRPPILTAWADPAEWQRVWSTNFAVSVPLGQFPGADKSQWSDYPSPWPDTATQRNYAVHGYYDPATTTWISGGYLHLKLWRGTGSIHSAAVSPKAARDVKYGRFIEVARVSKVTPGYKSAHLLWPVGNADNEVDFPESEWTVSPSAHVHYGANDSTVTFDTNVSWSDWHTYEIRWQPGVLAFYVDGKLVGRTTRGVPDVNMNWIIQNESALNGPSAPVNSYAQMDISYVEYDKYVG
jgi:glycosyl hydrolase family 16